jgi:hypothetical protein
MQAEYCDDDDDDGINERGRDFYTKYISIRMYIYMLNELFIAVLYNI